MGDEGVIDKNSYERYSAKANIKIDVYKRQTVVWITHYMQEAVTADRVIVVNDGQIALEGTPRAVFEQVERMREMRLDVPEMTEIAYELRARGVNVRADVMDVEEMVEEVCRLSSKN